jgi:antitoxin component YwqK of YwqJK toxin-antitoxin module
MVDDQKHGPWMQWHSNGNVESKGKYNHGQEDGLWSFWYADGQKEMEGKYVDGQMDGVWTTWTPSGDPSTIEFRGGAPVAPQKSVAPQ